MQNIHSKNQNKKDQGFTLIETLVAIAVLMIAIAGPLVAASRGLTAALYSRNQTIATMLAQEGVELIRSYKDNEGFGALKSALRLNNPPQDCTSTTPCGVSIANETGNITLPVICSINNNCQLRIDNSNHVGYINGPATSDPKYSTIFTRKFYIEPTNSDTEIKVVVVVSWNEGRIPSEVRIENQMTEAPL